MTPDPRQIVAALERVLSAPTPTASLRALSALREQLDQLERAQVARALSEGQTFTSIARPLGISRQAAHRRYRDLAAPRPCPPTPARPCCARARRRRGTGSVSIDGEHLLLALADAGALRLDVDAARRSFAPPAINAPKPSGLHPALHARLRARARDAVGRRAPARRDGGPGRAAPAGPLRRAAHSRSLLTVAQLRTVAVPVFDGLLSTFISFEFCIPSGQWT